MKIRNQIFVVLLAAVAAFASVPAAHAATILQDSSDVTVQIKAFEPTGQSFTAENSFVTASFAYGVINGSSPIVFLTISLFEGSGFGGSLLLSESFTGPVGAPLFPGTFLMSILAPCRLPSAAPIRLAFRPRVPTEAHAFKRVMATAVVRRSERGKWQFRDL
jgi:hypothetical protein